MSELTMSNLKDRLGSELGVSDWMLVDQELINEFAKCTGDRQCRSTSTSGQNPKSLSGEELGPERRVDAGSEALSAQGAACLIGAEEVVTGVSDDGEVQRRGVFSGSAAVFVEGRVHRPMEIALDPAMGAHCGENGLGIGFEGC